jgi:hypothetical protein
MSDKRYAIWVSVWGGVTGPRAAWLKDVDGKQRTFTDKDEALLAAKVYRETMNSPHATAMFNAVVMELSHE